MLGALNSQLANIGKQLAVSSTMQQAFSKIATAGDHRAAFSAVLLATAAQVEKKPNFNLELEINDLMIRLGNLRGMSSTQALANVGNRTVGQQQQVFSQMSDVMSKLDEAMLAVVRNIK